MRTLQRVAIVVAAVGCLSTVGAGVSIADGGPEANAWAVSSSASGATSRGGGGYGGEQAAPQPAPQAAPQPVQQAPAPQPVQQAPAPQAAPQPVQQAPAPQPVQQAPAPQVAEPVQQGPAQESGRREEKKIDIKQAAQCRSHDLNVDVLGQVGVLNGVLGNALNGEGAPGGQHTHQGSRMGCDNVALPRR
ncbi:hypothetical protein GCM10010211_15110 [Streptomyces albospinus]|uniref:Uncharacterized protein n=1 Tax=Streptomyces albospinus TaxID=285515 RepID=A0ABQ2UV11_9ACTN|nr:hypothetical protein GCM10010211_15110 [Streptomyces albospinus]